MPGSATWGGGWGGGGKFVVVPEGQGIWMKMFIAFVAQYAWQNGKYILICVSVVVLVKPVVYTFGTLYKYTVLI